jgi:hypothetical protein
MRQLDVLTRCQYHAIGLFSLQNFEQNKCLFITNGSVFWYSVIETQNKDRWPVIND